MVKEIIKYPTPTGIEYAPDVRAFDKELCQFIDDLKETAVANSLDGLSAAQVGSYYNVVIVKVNSEDEDYLELMNPRVLNKKGTVITRESSSYFPNVDVEIERYDSISLVYEDRAGEQHSLKADGAFSILLQRKIDYLFGANFLTKLKDEKREDFTQLLSSNGASCPTPTNSFSRDYFVKTSNYVMIGMVILLLSSFLLDNKESLWLYQVYSSLGVVGINIAYTLYSYYENKKFSICTNCYNMSIFGVVAIGLVRLTMIMVASYFIL